MTIRVSHHAVERYAQRIIGVPEGEKPTGMEYRVIETVIRMAVERRSPVDATRKHFRVRAPDATYVIMNHKVVTVLHPSMEHERIMRRRKQIKSLGEQHP